MESIRKE